MDCSRHRPAAPIGSSFAPRSSRAASRRASERCGRPWRWPKSPSMSSSGRAAAIFSIQRCRAPLHARRCRGAADLGVPGVVVGCLKRDGTIDEPRMSELVATAGPLSVTCHRAFDMTRDPGEALEALVRCGIARVLTSGQRDNAVDGAPLLRRLVEQAGQRIIILGCGALAPETIAAVRRATGLRELHFAALRDVPSGMGFRNPGVGMGGTDLDREYRVTVTDAKLVAATIEAARKG